MRTPSGSAHEVFFSSGDSFPDIGGCRIIRRTHREFLPLWAWCLCETPVFLFDLSALMKSATRDFQTIRNLLPRLDQKPSRLFYPPQIKSLQLRTHAPNLARWGFDRCPLFKIAKKERNKNSQCPNPEPSLVKHMPQRECNQQSRQNETQPNEPHGTSPRNRSGCAATNRAHSRKMISGRGQNLSSALGAVSLH